MVEIKGLIFITEQYISSWNGQDFFNCGLNHIFIILILDLWKSLK